LLLALYLMISSAQQQQQQQDNPMTWRSGLSAGLALGAAVCLWFPYVLVVPAVLLAPVLLFKADRPRLRLAVWVGVGLSVLLGVAYGTALVCLGITDVAGFRAWMAQSSHGVKASGLPRAVFGLARSFLNMGDDGVLFKRFLLKDPYNPVSLGDLI